MRVGSLYNIKRYHWILFPSKDTIETIKRSPGISPTLSARGAVDLANWYRRRKLADAATVEGGKGSYFLLLEEDGPLKKVLTPAGLVGWICVTGEYATNFEEVIKGP